jgi:hypothetical protein
MGDIDLDLGIVATSWCFNGDSLDMEKLNALSYGYGKVVRQEYIRYGLLYYTTTRYLNGRNYRELLERFSQIPFTFERKGWNLNLESSSPIFQVGLETLK